MSKIPYPVRSMLFFAVFQILLFPLMVLGYMTDVKFIYKLGAVQSIAITSMFNYLVHGEAQPSTIYLWYFIGIPLYAFVGWIIGKGLQKSHFITIHDIYKLLSSLIIFEIALLVLITTTQHQEIWSLNTGW